jgi:hypothetical protein
MEALVVILIVSLLLIEGHREAISAPKKRDARQTKEWGQHTGGSGDTLRDRLQASAVLTPHARRVLFQLGKGARAIVHYNSEPSMKTAELQSPAIRIVVNPKTCGRQRVRSLQLNNLRRP